ncbi:MAG: NB-ARC domain-containing protein [Acinetobacter johnsonii]
MSSMIKRKTTWLLHEIEEALGSFVLNNGDVNSLNLDSLEKIRQREVDRGRIFNKNSIKDVVEATYLDELFGFALDIARDSSLIDSINYLYSLFHHLDIYEIRNAISHPNKPFWDCYWYRVAAIASDPVNEILGLQRIKHALEQIEMGEINDPPADWVSKIIWQIPNNLPEQFDHGLTGLIGRSKELNDLKRYISNPRINTVALVAPGGLGKTALALDLLNTIISTPSFSKVLDSVVFITMKTEKLTSSGVITLDSIQTMDELKNNIINALNDIYDEDYTTFEEVTETLKDQKILLCIDNLETLLREKQESFEEFNYELPQLWQVLITSRISIPNATILSLDTLKESSAIHLARTYMLKRGMSPLQDDSYLQLTKGCFYNPLAIRLTIDFMMTGKDIPDSLNVANKEIAEFSYNNLINVLSDNSISILEAIFVEDISTRMSLCELLNISIDEVSAAVGELSRTSLISRTSSEQGETYKLSDSVRDLLLVSPKNLLVRKDVQDLIIKRRNLSNEIDIRQIKKEVPIWHSDYIPNETNPNLKILVTEVNSNIRKSAKNTEIAVSLFKKLKDSRFIYNGIDLYHRAFGRVLEALKDYRSAEEQYLLAKNCDDKHPSSYYLLGRLYNSTNQFDEAKNAYEKLIDMGWTSTDENVVQFGKSIYTGYYLSLLYAGKYDVVFEKTENWEEAGPYRFIQGTYRAGAFKRTSEKLVEENPEATINSLLNAVAILSDVFKLDGYSRTANKQAIKIIEEIEYCLARPIYYQKKPSECKILLEFAFNNIFEIDQLDNNGYLNDLIKRLSELNIPENIFNQKLPIESYNFTPLNTDYVDKGYDLSDKIAVKVSNRPKERASFLFAKDIKGEDYFLHFDNLKNGGWRNWCQISLGQDMFIKYESSVDSAIDGQALKASEVYL